MRQVPHIQELWEQYQGKGLHIFHVESQNHSHEKVLLFTRKRGVTFPNPILNWCDFPLINSGAVFDWGYNCAKLPRTYLIGVDGNVIWEGKFGYDDLLAEELKKVKYPGLFRLEVAKPLRSIAETFGKGGYGKALAAAENKLQTLKDEQAISDAEWIIKRANEIAERRQERVDMATDDLRYHDAIKQLDLIADEFSGTALGKDAAKKKKDLQKDPVVKKELEAWNQLEKLLDQYPSRSSELPGYLDRLDAFATKHEGQRAGEEATDLADGLSDQPRSVNRGR